MTNFHSEEFLRQQAIQARCFHPTGQWSEFPHSALQHSIVTRLEEIVERYPTHLAIKMGDEQVTYLEFNQAANQLAQAILSLYGEGAEPIVCLLEQSVQAIVVLFAILKTGKFYVVLETTQPEARLQTILADTQSRVIVTNRQHSALASRLATAGQAIFVIEDQPSEQPIANPCVAIAAGDIAYLVYTSGTTGRPKGVIENHRNVLHFTRVFTNFWHPCPQDRMGLITANSFSGSASTLFSALLNGAGLYLFEPAKQGMAAMIDWLKREEITHCLAVPSLFRQWLQACDSKDSFPHLRFIGLGGDRVLPTDIALYHQHLAPHCLARIGYGLSEVKIVTQYLLNHTTPIPVDVVPIGYCMEETAVLLLDEQGNEVGANAIGEIVVKSRYLSPGYWQQPALTATRFLSDPADPEQRLYYTGDLGRLQPNGCLLYLGRKDQQVKISGIRIEIAEIEQAIQSTGVCKEVVVTARTTEQGEQRLVAYLVADNTALPSITNLRQQLAAILPASMIPEVFIMLDSLPHNSNGKLDLKALPAPGHYRPNIDSPFIAPRTPIEATLATIWRDVLAIEPIGVDDPFLDLGGNSVRAIQIVTRVLKTFQVDLPVTTLFERATIGEMAKTIHQDQLLQLADNQLEELVSELEMLSEQRVTELLPAPSLRAR